MPKPTRRARRRRPHRPLRAGRCGRHASGSTRMRCSSLQTRKHRRRHVPSSSRCQGISTRCTGVPHSWHGGEAAAISSALVMAFCCAAWSRAGTHPGARVPCDRRSRLLRNSGVPGPRASSLIEIRRRFAGSFGPARRLLNGPFVQRSHASVMQAVDAASRCSVPVDPRSAGSCLPSYPAHQRSRPWRSSAVRQDRPQAAAKRGA
jgi:hypothetical protein